MFTGSEYQYSQQFQQTAQVVANSATFTHLLTSDCFQMHPIDFFAIKFRLQSLGRPIFPPNIVESACLFYFVSVVVLISEILFL